MDEWKETEFPLRQKAKRQKCEGGWFTFIYQRAYRQLIKEKLKFPLITDLAFNFLVGFILSCYECYLTFFSSLFVSSVKLYLLLVCGMKVKVKSLSCVRLCDPMDCSLPGPSACGILQARVLEWVAISFLQEIFPTQGSNPGLPHCRQTLYHLSHQERLRSC